MRSVYVLSVCHRCAVGILSVCCWFCFGILSVCGRYDVGMLSVYIRYAVGMHAFDTVPVCCRCAVSVLNAVDMPSLCLSSGGAAHAAGVRPGDNVVGVNGRIPLGYTQVMGTLPTAPRPVGIRFIRLVLAQHGHGHLPADLQFWFAKYSRTCPIEKQS